MKRFHAHLPTAGLALRLRADGSAAAPHRISLRLTARLLRLPLKGGVIVNHVRLAQEGRGRPSPIPPRRPGGVYHSGSSAMEPLSLSIVIPAYNEAERIEQTLETVRHYLQRQPLRAEVLVVNDGSQDRTGPLVAACASHWRDLRLVDNPRNLGKGFSIRNGALEARGQVVLISDADLSAPIDEMPKLVDPILRGDRDLTLGSRALDRSLIGVHQSPFREYAGRLFNGLVQLLTGLPFRDTQCGFKAFRREPMLPVLARQRIAGFGFDPEILFLARNRGLRLQEVPVRWNHTEGTKVRLLQDGLKMVLGLILIRWNQLTGKYR